ncbi:hypothetical protein HYH03_016343 [Edaphochlamys debaryana]|uniref:Uncharacterized protein n=1 Tax=Edaphochlamys debaryana TaxID=47281 RepID=A0A836BQC2_9CHLO|nr:hypothetical protein HYH03_016343 [Edaphochlamys debaryana]|eukprot:KAG2484857.1 hypothetical protein HYH03_016343 [Edaphochlamys debaryana]
MRMSAALLSAGYGGRAAHIHGTALEEAAYRHAQIHGKAVREATTEAIAVSMIGSAMVFCFTAVLLRWSLRRRPPP